MMKAQYKLRTQAQGTCWLVNTLMCLEGNVLGRSGPRGEDPEALQAGPPHPDLAIGWSWFMSFRVKLSLYV